jgi:hypothetical protein
MLLFHREPNRLVAGIVLMAAGIAVAMALGSGGADAGYRERCCTVFARRATRAVPTLPTANIPAPA